MGISGRIAKYFLHSQMTPLLALVAVLLGLFAVLVTPREEEPQISVTMANVMIAFPGASARDVAQTVATPAEQVLSQIAGVDHVYSVAQPGMAVITVQFKVGEEHIASLVKLYDVVHSHADWLPPTLGVAPPIIKAKGIDDVPVVALTLWREQAAGGGIELTQVAHAIEAELKRVPGTREVNTLGATQRMVRVLLRPESLNAHQLTMQDIRTALQSANVSQNSGMLVQNNREVLVQTGNFLREANEVRQLVVGVVNAKPVFLRDVADVQDGADQRHAQLRRDRQRQGDEADPETAVRHPRRGRAGVVCDGTARGAGGRHRGAADAGGDAVCVVGMGLHAESRVAVRADLLDRNIGRRRDCRGGKHPSPPRVGTASILGRNHSGCGGRSRQPDHSADIHAED